MDRLENPYKLGLQTNEYVVPSKARGDLFNVIKHPQKQTEWMNRLIYGDNLLTMQALLAGDEESDLPSMRGKIDLIILTRRSTVKRITEQKSSCLMAIWSKCLPSLNSRLIRIHGKMEQLVI
jgi:hypothetical protein